tara:strand:+ start:81 stop:437 length:357 start_codon:yes stop_codon:yes gene_type:complete
MGINNCHCNVANKRIKMKTKEKVKFWLNKYEHLKDDDNKLCCNIWNEEIRKIIIVKNSTYRDFLRLYAAGKLTSAPSIKRARAKLQEEEPQYRGEKYNQRKGTLQDEWRKDLGYEVNQ